MQGARGLALEWVLRHIHPDKDHELWPSLRARCVTLRAWSSTCPTTHVIGAIDLPLGVDGWSSRPTRSPTAALTW